VCCPGTAAPDFRALFFGPPRFFFKLDFLTFSFFFAFQNLHRAPEAHQRGPSGTHNLANGVY
jgi:hypothetical protein